jgi:glycosyltransferase involved in cell wall biosynthesis
VDFWDVDAMSDAIYGLLQYPAISQLAARCGYDEVNSIKWNDVAAKIKGIYQEVIDKK